MATMKRTRKNKSYDDLKTTAPVVDVSARNLDIQDAIVSYAYSLYEQRSREHGHDLDDWLRAESEVLTHIGT